MKRNMKLSTIFGIMVTLIIGCEQTPEIKTSTSEGSIVIMGENELTETLIIPAGTKIYFRHTTPTNCGTDNVYAGITIRNGGKIVAQGTADNPIIFESDMDYEDYLRFEENASNDSIFEYCEIASGINMNIDNSISIHYSRLDRVKMSIGKNSETSLQYNTLFRCNIEIKDTTLPSVTYNSLSNIDSENNLSGIWIDSTALPVIENNNITNTISSAIYYDSETSSYTVNSNYIAFCDNKTDVDTDGSQSHNVIYVNPRTDLVTGAGCGW